MFLGDISGRSKKKIKIILLVELFHSNRIKIHNFQWLLKIEPFNCEVQETGIMLTNVYVKSQIAALHLDTQ